MSWLSLHYHVVFSTKGRAMLLSKTISPRIYAYLGGIVRDTGGTALSIGGIADHVHILAMLPATQSLADMISRVKSLSSGWIHRTFPDMKLFQ